MIPVDLPNLVGSGFSISAFESSQCFGIVPAAYPDVLMLGCRVVIILGVMLQWQGRLALPAHPSCCRHWWLDWLRSVGFDTVEGMEFSVLGFGRSVVGRLEVQPGAGFRQIFKVLFLPGHYFRREAIP